jgi:hypothetical protein
MYTIDKECEQRMICLRNHLLKELGEDYKYKEPRFLCVADGEMFFRIDAGFQTHYFIVDKELIENFNDGFNLAYLLSECDGWINYQLNEGNKKVFDLDDECPYTQEQIKSYERKIKVIIPEALIGKQAIIKPE